jgi:hypothetical protein
VKIAMLVAASEYERLTLDVARSSPMECLLGRVFSLNVVSGPASGVFSRDASVFVSSRILHYRLSDIIR